MLPATATLRKVGLTLAIATVLLAIIATQWPFEYRFEPWAVRKRMVRIEWSLFPRTPRGNLRIDSDLVLNLLMLVPLGLGFGLWRQGPRWRVAAESLALGCATSVMLELAQLVARNRHTSVADVWRNTVSCGLGCTVALAVLWLVTARQRQPVA